MKKSKRPRDPNQLGKSIIGTDEESSHRRLQAFWPQIERAFGKGSIMKLGKAMEVGIEASRPARSASTSRSASAACRAAASSRSTGRKARARPRWRCTPSPKRRRGRRHLRLRRRRTRARSVYARKLGVNIDDLLISQPDTGEQALEIADTLVRSGAVDVLVVDSVAALTPRPNSKARWATACPACRPA
jgi:recombination protein RecA